AGELTLGLGAVSEPHAEQVRVDGQLGRAPLEGGGEVDPPAVDAPVAAVRPDPLVSQTGPADLVGGDGSALGAAVACNLRYGPQVARTGDDGLSIGEGDAVAVASAQDGVSRNHFGELTVRGVHPVPVDELTHRRPAAGGQDRRIDVEVLELVSTVQDQLLVEQEQPGQLPGLQYGPLAVLAGHDEAHLEGRVGAVGALAERVPDDVALPRVQVQPDRVAEVDGLVSGAGDVVRDVLNPRTLRPCERPGGG